MHAEAQAKIKECYAKFQGGDPAYKSLTQSLHSHLKVTVSDEYWKKAKDYLYHHLLKKQKEARAGEKSHGSSQQQRQPPQHLPRPLSHGGPPPTASALVHNPIQRPPALTKQQDAQKRKDKEEKLEAAKKRRNAIAKAKRAAAKKEKDALQRNEVRLAGTTSFSSAHTSTTPAVPSSSVMPASASVSGVVSKKDTKKKSTKASVTKKKKAEASYKFKDNVDHAFLIDVTSIPNILSKDHKLDLNLDEEQRILLYGDQQQREKMRVITDAAVDALSAGAVDGALSEAGIPQLPWELPAVHEGWGERNLLSVRTVWAKVRLPESELQQIDKLQQGKSIESEANTHSGTTSSRIASTHIEARAPTRLEDDTTNHVWHNEARAEQDPTLALLSEATEMYLKEAIESAVGKARHRQNLDGVRLWHTLHSHHADPNSTSGKPPPALIRLGCDVRRQLALADGNAVKTYQRMEEAIGRNNDTFHFEAEDPTKTILEATSMADLSRQPPLRTAVSDAGSEAKRKFEVFAGKIQEPPFGRVPKKAKVILTDLSLGAVRNNQTPEIRARRKQLLGGW
eukprot:scaffold3867_cov115-Skeletonema_dohrnii-CCMP3373.AAC.10